MHLKSLAYLGFKNGNNNNYSLQMHYKHINAKIKKQLSFF